jgi:hypothetical protein
MMRELTGKEIEECASRPGAKKIAVENFLMSMGTDLTIAMGNLGIDAKQYGWSQDTIDAIVEGMWLAAGLEEGDMVVV